MRTLVASGELAELAHERVWQELARGLMEPQPSRMLVVLRECGALAEVLPEVDALFGASAATCAAGHRATVRRRMASLYPGNWPTRQEVFEVVTLAAWGFYATPRLKFSTLMRQSHTWVDIVREELRREEMRQRELEDRRIRESHCGP